MASPVPLPNRVELLYKGHQDLNIIFGISSGSIAVMRLYTGGAEFDNTAILICLVDFIMLVLVCGLPQSMISIYSFIRKGSCVGLEAYIWTGAMVLDHYMALLMINIEYIRIGLIPVMILVFIVTLGWKLRESGTVKVGSSEQDHDGVNNDKLELFDFVSYHLLLSFLTLTQYKGRQGCTPVLSDFLLFLGSALGALETMLASPLAGLNSRAMSVEVLPVLHKTRIVVLFIAVHTLAAEWLGDDMIYVCLPELITVLVWFMVYFGESMSVSSFTSVKSELIFGSSVVTMLAGFISLNANDGKMMVARIIWTFWICLSSSAFCQFHVWLLHGWPGSSSESKELIRLLNVATRVGSVTAAILLLCAYMMVTDTRILCEAIYSFEHKAMAGVVAVISLLAFLVWSACCFPGHLETQTGLTVYLWYARTILQSKQKDMGSVNINETVGTPAVSKYEINPKIIMESGQILKEKEPYRNPEHESEENLEEQRPADEYKRMTSTMTKMGISTEQTVDVYVEFNCLTHDYAAFMDDLSAKLADHPGKDVVQGRPVLAKESLPAPKRWVHIKLVGEDNRTITLAVRDDNLYLVGFQAQNGWWYEFGFDHDHLQQIKMLRGKESIFLGCDGSYRSLLGSEEKGGKLTDRRGIMSLQMQLQLGKRSALDAISSLSAYDGGRVDVATRRSLAVLVVMICESARLAPIYNTVKNGWDKGAHITEQQLLYINNWRGMSDFLMGQAQSRLWNIGIVDEKDAAAVVNLVCNSWAVRRQHVPRQALVHGRPVLEVFSVKTKYHVTGTIRVVDSKGGRIITFSYPIKGAICTSQGNDPVSVRTTSVAPSGHISAINSFSVKVNPDGGSYEYCSDGDDNFTDESKSVSSSSITTDSTDDAETDLELDGSTVMQIPYDGDQTDSVMTRTTEDGKIEVTYVVLSKAVEATVQVKLKPKGVVTPRATIRVYGEIAAQFNGGNIILLSRNEKDGEMQVDVLQNSDGFISIPIPLARSVFAVTVKSRLILKVRLHVACSSYDMSDSTGPVGFWSHVFEDDDLAFPNFGQRPKHTRKIDGPGMVAHVLVTAS